VNLKTFHADSMAEALSLVKRTLGPHAVILHTRKYKRGGILGLGARQVVEVTAADRMEVKARTAPRAAGRVAPRAAPPRREPEPMAGDLIRRTYAAAQAEMRSRQASMIAAPPAAAAAPSFAVASPGIAPSVARFAAPDLTHEMRVVQRMVGRMVSQQRIRESGGVRQDMPEKLFDQYLALLRHEVAEELAEEVVEKVRSSLTASQMDDADAVRRAVLGAVAGFIPTDDAAAKAQRPADGRPRTIALIGPTGVGKTTTIAKLAATFKLRQKLGVALITLDTYRIAAVEQLRTYANIIGVPLHVVASPEEMRGAIEKCRGADAVLIDTAGRSQRDDPRLEQLRTFIDAANPHEVHLVLSSTGALSVLMDAVERFSAIRTDRILFTKLDEAVSFGVLLTVARKVNKRLSYVTTGQEVPHQIEPGRADRLAELVLGGGV
jgi:flagellar biosynthesis protein FlhF